MVEQKKFISLNKEYGTHVIDSLSKSSVNRIKILKL